MMFLANKTISNYENDISLPDSMTLRTSLTLLKHGRSIFMTSLKIRNHDPSGKKEKASMFLVCRMKL